MKYSTFSADIGKDQIHANLVLVCNALDGNSYWIRSMNECCVTITDGRRLAIADTKKLIYFEYAGGPAKDVEFQIARASLTAEEDLRVRRALEQRSGSIGLRSDAPAGLRRGPA